MSRNAMKIRKRDNAEERHPARHETHRPFLSLREAMNRLFDESFLDPFENFPLWQHGSLRGTGFPHVDISESDAEITVTADVPGVDPEKIDIEVDEDSLALSGSFEKEDKEEDSETKFYRYERQFGSFHREFMLPAKVDTENVKAQAKNGVLRITLPKIAPEKRKKVKVE